MEKSKKHHKHYKTETVEIPEEVALRIERAMYLWRGRKEIIDRLLQNGEGNYNEEMLLFYQRLYDEAYLDFRRIQAFVECELLSGYAGRGRFRWELEMSTNSIYVTLLDEVAGQEAGV